MGLAPNAMAEYAIMPVMLATSGMERHVFRRLQQATAIATA
jgi:hypothetical protein